MQETRGYACNLFQQTVCRLEEHKLSYHIRETTINMLESSARAGKEVPPDRFLPHVLFLPDTPGVVCSVAGRQGKCQLAAGAAVWGWLAPLAKTPPCGNSLPGQVQFSVVGDY